MDAINVGGLTGKFIARVTQHRIMQEVEMNESISRMTESGNPPSESAIMDWIGKEAYKY